jgi:membrane-bound lytic murein transglycosylase F
MNKNSLLLISVVMSLVFFSFGWLSHSAYTPGKRISKPSLLAKIKRKRILNVVLLNAPSIFYIGNDGKQGFEYDLLKSYADYLDVDLNFTSVHTTKEALSFSKDLNIDIISAAITKTKSKSKKFNFGPSYFEVQEQVICSRKMPKGKKFPRDIEDLTGLRMIVGEGTSYSETLESLVDDGFDIDVRYTEEYSTEELLGKVASNKIDCTVADSNIYAINLRYFTEIALAFSISGHEQLAWIFPKKSETLKQDMYSWLNVYNQSGKMAQLRDHYYSYVLLFDYYNTKMFYKRIKTRLSRYKSFFKVYGEKYNIPWTLLAAMSYQESHWNPNAKSFTGVRGLMMLTNHTAKILGVKNRLDPKQSIIGGTRHIKQMIRTVPKGIKSEDKLRFALAAYNVGMGHIYDAQKLAKKLGYNPNIWSDLKKVLPLLSEKKYYRYLKYGYARGSEPVKYVEAIYNYRDLLENHLDKSEDKKETN